MAFSTPLQQITISKKMFEIKGKVALITGAARGIGFAIAKALLKNGAKGVALLDIQVERGRIAEKDLTEQFVKGCAIFIETDVTDKTQFEGAFEKTLEFFGRLDIVVNHAGIMQELQWEKCVNVNMTGCMTGSLLAVNKYFSKYPSHSPQIILNTASLAGLIPFGILPVYTATKHGIVGFSRSLAESPICKETNVKVIAMCPSRTSSEMEEEVGTDQISEELLKMLRSFSLTFPSQTPEELAEHAISIMEEADSGSVWIIEDNQRRVFKFSDFE